MAYPYGTLETDAVDATTSATEHPQRHNDVASALNDLLTVLGTDPAGSEATVTAAIAALQAGGGGGGSGDAAWHEIGAAGEPAFENSWVNFGAPYSNAAYRKDGEGYVHLRGLLKSGGASATMFTLPAGYRPAATDMHLVLVGGTGAPAGGATGRVDLSSTGAVTPVSLAATAWVSLNAIKFVAGQ